MRDGAWVRTIGWGGYASYLLATACGRIPHVRYRRQRIVSVARAAIPAMPRSYSGRALTYAELAAHDIDADRPTQKTRFAHGLTCLGLFDRHGVLVGVTWLGQGQHHDPETGLTYMLPADAAWDAGLWISEDRRLSRAFVGLWALVGDWLDERGLSHSISSIADYNAASIGSHARMGARTLGHVCVMRVGSWQFSIGARPWLERSAASPRVDLACI